MVEHQRCFIVPYEVLCGYSYEFDVHFCSLTKHLCVSKPCKVSDVLNDLVGAIKPLAHIQRRVVELHDLSTSLKVAVDEPALRQALSNLIEGALLRSKVSGRTDIISTGAPAGGALIIIDDDGPDMHYMVIIYFLGS